MRLTRLYVDAPLAQDSLLELPAEPALHVARVLRAREGDAIVVFNGDGREFEAVVDSVRGSRVAVAVRHGPHVDRESPLELNAPAMRAARRSHGLDRAKGDRTRRRRGSCPS